MGLVFQRDWGARGGVAFRELFNARVKPLGAFAVFNRLEKILSRPPRPATTPFS